MPKISKNKFIADKIVQKVEMGILIIKCINVGYNEYNNIVKIVQENLPDVSLVDVTKAISNLLDEKLIERIGKININAYEKYMKASLIDPSQTKVKMPITKYRITKKFLKLGEIQ